MSTIDDLEAGFRAAQAAVEAYSRKITEKYRAELPDSPMCRGTGPDPDGARARARAWTVEERTELARLRREAADAAWQLAYHLRRDRSQGPGG